MKILTDILIFTVIAVTLLFVYQTYSDDIRHAFFADETIFTVYVDTVTLTVSLADTESEREKGLSGVMSLPELGGKLFIFDNEDYYGIWMKDMLFPIDILWFNDNLELIHFEESVDPSSYPAIFSPDTPARFVLEVNANLVNALNMQLGDRLLLPSSILPVDVRNNLQ